ncbi:hypothetical protein FLACOL7796_04652 [Flavobacterium collinsii]|jgi:CTP:phosphocholine cytidylyltransferase-like protein|uniref:Uncharacterized protein n=1 Tax=Flavobacterium collinsii TaxID=1114861 RepID=A0ABN7ER91_9FLAO|nr:hypothetical protein FLACOL7796_04652 [Flavobacterium collinsii]
MNNYFRLKKCAKFCKLVMEVSTDGKTNNYYWGAAKNHHIKSK